MLERVHVKPASGRLVKLPGGIVVPAQGVICERTMFIERRLTAGDLVLVTPAAPTTAVTAGTCTLVGFDQDNNPVTEVIALACTVSTVFKSKWAYSSITSATVAAYAASGSGTGNKIAVGQSNDFGVSTGAVVSNFALVKATKVITTVTGGVTAWARAVTDDNAGGATVDAVARTVAPTTAPGVAGINDYEFTVSYTLGA